MDYLALVIFIERLLAEHTGLGKLHIRLVGLFLLLSVLITLLVWLRYMAAGAIVVVTAVNIFKLQPGGRHGHRRLRNNGGRI